MYLPSRTWLACAAVLLFLAGCGSSETTFVWDVPERPTREDTLFFGGSETRRQHLIRDATGTFNFPDGRSNTFEAETMWVDFDTTRDGNDDLMDDPLDDVEFLVRTDQAGLLPELLKLAEAAEIRVDADAVQQWIDTHDGGRDSSINIPITGWRPDEYVMFLTVVDRNDDDHYVSANILWPGSLDGFPGDPSVEPDFDLSSPYLLP